MLKNYLPSVIINVLLGLGVPVGIVLIFLSGDSCCGEDASGTMTAVTTGLVIINLIASTALSALYKRIWGKNNHGYNVLKGALLGVLLPAMSYLLYLQSLIKGM